MADFGLGRYSDERMVLFSSCCKLYYDEWPDDLLNSSLAKLISHLTVPVRATRKLPGSSPHARPDGKVGSGVRPHHLQLSNGGICAPWER